MVLHGEINGANNVGEIAGAIRMERLERENLGGRRDKMQNASHHRPVAERLILAAVNHGGGMLIDHLPAALVHGSFRGDGKRVPLGVMASSSLHDLMRGKLRFINRQGLLSARGSTLVSMVSAMMPVPVTP